MPIAEQHGAKLHYGGADAFVPPTLVKVKHTHTNIGFDFEFEFKFKFKHKCLKMGQMLNSANWDPGNRNCAIVSARMQAKAMATSRGHRHELASRHERNKPILVRSVSTLSRRNARTDRDDAAAPLTATVTVPPRFAMFRGEASVRLAHVSHNVKLDPVPVGTMLPFLAPVPLSARVTVSLLRGSTTLASVSLPPTRCPMVRGAAVEGHSVVFQPTDGGEHGMSLLTGVTRYFVNTEATTPVAQALPGSCHHVVAPGATIDTTSGVSLFTPPQTAHEVVFSILRTLAAAVSPAETLAITPRKSGDISITSQGSPMLVFRFTGSDADKTALGLPAEWVITRTHGDPFSWTCPRCYAPLPLDVRNQPAALASAVSAAAGFCTLEDLPGAIVVRHNASLHTTLTWPRGAYTLSHLVATFNALSTASMAAITGVHTGAAVQATLGAPPVHGFSALHAQVQFRGTPGDVAIGVQFAHTALAHAFGFLDTSVNMGTMVGGCVLPVQDVHLHTEFLSGPGVLHITPRRHPSIVGEVQTDGVTVTTQVYHSGEWRPFRHSWRAGDVVQACSLGTEDSATYSLTVASVAAESASSTLTLSAPPEGVWADGDKVSLRPLVSSHVVWVSPPAEALPTGVCTTYTPVLLGSAPFPHDTPLRFTGGRLPHRVTLCPITEVMLCLQNTSAQQGLTVTNSTGEEGTHSKGALGILEWNSAASVFTLTHNDIPSNISMSGPHLYIELLDPRTGKSTSIQVSDMTITLEFMLK